MTLKNAENDQSQQSDLKFMKMALALAKRSESLGEVPIGAVIVDENGKILSKATNLREKTTSVLGHAELVALHRASQKRKSWRLVGCTLYVTLEPCFMCAAALVQARVARVVFGAHDPKGGRSEACKIFRTTPDSTTVSASIMDCWPMKAANCLKNFLN